MTTAIVLSSLNYRLLANFFNFVMELKTIRRSGWINKVKIRNPESVADHTYVMSAMVMIFCDILGMKTERAMKMAILHDLGESIIGDYEPNVISSNEKRIKETEAIHHILDHLPPQIRKEYADIWKEYLGNETDLRHGLFIMSTDSKWLFEPKMYESQGYPSSILRHFYSYPNDERDGNDVIQLLKHTRDAFFSK